MLDRTFQAELVDGTLVVRGDIDDYGIITLRNLLAEHGTTPGGRLPVDLSEVDYLPSVAVGVLTKAIGAAHRAGAEIDLVARRGSRRPAGAGHLRVAVPRVAGRRAGRPAGRRRRRLTPTRGGAVSPRG